MLLFRFKDRHLDASIDNPELPDAAPVTTNLLPPHDASDVKTPQALNYVSIGIGPQVRFAVAPRRLCNSLGVLNFVNIGPKRKVVRPTNEE